MLNFKDLFIENVGLEKEERTSLPIVIQLIQTYFQDKDSGYENSSSKLGTIGNNNFSYVIDVPESTFFFKKIRKIINEYKVLKFSRAELFDKCYVIKIPDYSSQALSPGFLDFLPLVLVGDNVNGYQKVKQTHVGIIRSYSSKEAFILIDRKIGNDLSNFGLLIKFKRFYDQHNMRSSHKNLQTLEATMEYNSTSDTYSATFSVDTSVFAKGDEKRIAFYITKDNVKYKLENSELIKNIQIEIKNEKVSRQSDHDNHRDYYKSVMNMIYGKDNYMNNTITEESSNIDFTITIDNYLDVSDANITAVLEQNQKYLEVDEYFEPTQVHITEKYPNITSDEQLILVSYTKDNHLGTFGIVDANKEENVYTEIIPLNYEDRIFRFKMTTDGNLNIHTILQANKIYKPFLKLSEANILIFNGNNKFISPNKNINNISNPNIHVVDEGTIFNLKENDIVIVSIDKKIENCNCKDNTTGIAAEAVSPIFEPNFNQSNSYNKYLIYEDPYLESYKDISNNVSNNFVANSEDTKKDIKDIFAYDGITFDGIEDSLVDGEIRVVKQQVTFNPDSYDEDRDNDRSESLTIEKYILSAKKFTDSNNPNFKAALFYAQDVSLVETKFNNLYTDIVTKDNLYYDKFYNQTHAQLENVKSTFEYIYNNIENKNEPTANPITNENGFLFLGLTLDSTNLFDLEIWKNNTLYFVEYNCKPTDNDKIYIHLPFYLIDINEKGSISFNSNIFTFKIKNNTVKSYYFVK